MIPVTNYHNDDQQQARLTAQREQLSDDLFDGYMSNNHCVIDEVDARITGDVDAVDNLVAKLRENWAGDGRAIRTAYMKIIASVCDEIASGYDNVDKAYHDYRM